MDGTNPPNQLNVLLTMSDETATALRKHGGEVAVAEALEIDSPEAAQYAASELKRIADARTKIKTFYDGFIEPAKKIIENAKALFNPADAALERADEIIRQKLTVWTVERQRIEQEQRRQQEEAELRARQEADAKAAVERAKAAEISAAAQREADEAEQRRQDAVAAGDTKGAARAAAEVAAKQEKAVAVIETGEARAAEVQIAAQAKATTVAVTSSKVKGFGLRDNWIAVAVGDEDKAKLELCRAIVGGRTDLLALIKVDESAMTKLAKALKAQFTIPGFKAVNQPTAARTR